MNNWKPELTIEPTAPMRDAEPSRNRSARNGLPELLTTRDQRRVLLRVVVPGDEVLLERFFSGLSPAARRMRFHGGVRTVSRQVLQRMTRWDTQHEFALLALAIDDAEPTCIGEARYAIGEGARNEREFALVVEDAWQGVGLGGAMLGRLTRHAQWSGIDRLSGDVMPENNAMIGLAKRQGYSLRSHPEDARLRLLTRSLERPREQATPWPLLAMRGLSLVQERLQPR